MNRFGERSKGRGMTLTARRDARHCLTPSRTRRISSRGERVSTEVEQAERADPDEGTPPGFFEVALSAPVVRRALIYLVVVGTVLISINHGDAILRGDIDATRAFKMMLTPLVPYVVSTLSSVSAIRERGGA